MDWLLQHWQSLAALGIVGLVAVLFVRNLIRPNKSGGCGGGCDCPKPGQEKL